MMGLRIDPELKEFFKRFADQENRNLSNFILNAVITYIREHKGVDWQKDDKTYKP